MPDRTRRLRALAASLTVGLALSACSGPGLPASAVKGTKVAVGWSGSLTSTNAVSMRGLTPGNIEVASLTRSQFARVVEGAPVADASFGSVKMVDKKPFKVRYDLAEPAWSDGVPIDAADLLLALAAGVDRRAGFEVLPIGALAQGAELAEVDEFARAIDVRFGKPALGWETAIDVAVPAHVVGQIAFGVEDPMEAKQKVAKAVRAGDSALLSKIARVWNEAFVVSPTKATDASRFVSSGPYRIDAVSTTKAGGQRVVLVANGAYAGSLTPKIERLVLQQLDPAAQEVGLGTSLDVIQVPPTAGNWQRFHELERRDYKTMTSHDGTMWVFAVRAAGLFVQPAARAAFLRTVPRGDLTKAAAGEWSAAYESSDVLLTAPGSDGYDIAEEDSGFAAVFSRDGDLAAARSSAGVPDGTAVCVAYDASDAFARGAFGSLGPAFAEAGWAIRDCGRPGFKPTGTDWQAAIVRVLVPTSPTDIAALWGGNAALNLSGLANKNRDDLITQLSHTADPYAVRDLRAQVEKSIVGDVLALPLAMNGRVTVTAPWVTGVVPRPGADASLLAAASDWSVVPPQ